MAQRRRAAKPGKAEGLRLKENIEHRTLNIELNSQDKTSHQGAKAQRFFNRRERREHKEFLPQKAQKAQNSNNELEQTGTKETKIFFPIPQGLCCFGCLLLK
jgi:hypothetical protein